MSTEMKESCTKLIFAAWDHALYAAAITAGLIRWEPFQPLDGRGEICCGGLRYCATLDEFGVPQLIAHTRAAIQKATTPTP